MTDEFTAKTPGDLLRAARDGRGMSVAEVADLTKIPPRLIEAIERDEYHQLSGSLYAKSFLRAYGSCVGVDVAQLLALYDGATGAAPAEGAAEGVWQTQATTVRRVGIDYRVLLVRGVLWLGGLALVGWLIWRFGFAGRNG